MVKKDLQKPELFIRKSIINQHARILIVEDEAVIASDLKEALIQAGYEVTAVVSSGELAVQKAAEERPDLVLMDIRLSGALDGVEAAAQIRQQSPIPVIYLAAHADADVISCTKAPPPCEYLLKPVHLQELQLTIAMALYKHHLETELHATNQRLEQEIAEHKRAEESLRESERKLKDAQKMGHLGHWEFEIDTQTITWSDQVFTLYDRDPALGAPSPEEEATYYTPEQTKILREYAQKAIETGNEFEYDFQAILPGGRKVDFSSSMRPIKDENGRVVKLFGTVQDITERKQDQGKIQKERAKLNAINRVLQETMICETAADIARVCLQSAEELTGSRFGFICKVNQAGRFDTIAISDPGWNACRIPETNALLMLNDLEVRGIRGRVIRDEQSLIFNNPMAHPDWIEPPQGHPPITSFLGVPLKFQGKTFGIIGLGNKESGYACADQEVIETLSLTFAEALQRKQAEAALRESERQLRELNASKDKFFSILAHDLKNSLIGFLSFAKLLEQFETLEKAEFKDLTSQFRTSAENLFTLLENLLLWSQIQRGMLEPFLQEIPIGAFAVQNIKLLTPNAAHKQIRLTNLVQEEIPVVVDVNMIDTVIRNLLSNAIKFTHAGGAVEISATYDQDVVTVAVSDTGIGIPAEKLPNLFRIDAKCQQAGTAGEKGTGLGLILCKEFVEKHGGKIWVESEVGKGTTVWFTLPKEPHEQM